MTAAAEALLTDDEWATLDELETREMEELSGAGLYRFLERIWPLIEPATPFIGGKHVLAICEHLAALTVSYYALTKRPLPADSPALACAIACGDIPPMRDLIINIAPRHLKSIITSVAWPCWEWGPANLPFLRWIFSSYAQILSTRDSQKRRTIINSEFYQSRWGDRVRIGRDRFGSDGAIKYSNAARGYHLSTSVKGSNTGEGGDRIITDDPHNVKERESEAVRTGTLDWWDQVMSTRRNNPRTAARVVIMQRVHQQDLAGHLLEQGSGYVHLCLPTIFEKARACVTPIFRDWRTTDGELLHGDRYGPVEVAQAQKELGSLGFAGQHQQAPAPPGGGIVQQGWWRFWTRAPGLPNSLPEHFRQRFMVWDCAFKKDAHHSWVVGQVWGVQKPNLYLLAQIRAHIGIIGTLKAVKDMHAQWPGVPILIEDKANGTAVIEMLQTEVAGVLPLATGQESKEVRAATAAPYIESGNVFLPDPKTHPWVGDPAAESVSHDSLIGEWNLFPNGSTNDRVDCTTHAIIHAFIKPTKIFGAGNFA